MLPCSTSPQTSTYLRAQYSTLLRHWPLPRTVKPMQLGMCNHYQFVVPLLTKHSYLNGSILLATLQPAFTILHTLSTPRAPSPIVSLAWHASSTKQKSDMLATQTADGDLRVWSVSKPTAAAMPQTIRVLKGKDNVDPGLNWAAWSKNGRILQFSDG